jgi:glutamate receptor, ionotropic, invertebrate
MELSVESFVENNSGVQTRVSCDDDNSTMSDETNIVDEIMKRANTSAWIYSDNSIKVWQNLKFDVITNDEDNADGLRTTATVDRSGLKLMNGRTQFDPLSRFFRIGVTESIPYTSYKRDPITNEILKDNNGNAMFEGYCIDFIEKLSTQMNFTYELVEPETGKFGVKDIKTGRFDGLVGDLVRGKIDFIVGALKITADREEVIDFVIPYFDETGILIVMKKPLPDHSLFKFMSVLRLEVWLSILGALCGTAVFIWLLDIFSPYSARNWDYNEDCR